MSEPPREGYLQKKERLKKERLFSALNKGPIEEDVEKAPEKEAPAEVKPLPPMPNYVPDYQESARAEEVSEPKTPIKPLPQMPVYTSLEEMPAASEPVALRPPVYPPRAPKPGQVLDEGRAKDLERVRREEEYAGKMKNAKLFREYLCEGCGQLRQVPVSEEDMEAIKLRKKDKKPGWYSIDDGHYGMVDGREVWHISTVSLDDRAAVQGARFLRSLLRMAGPVAYIPKEAPEGGQ